MRIRSKIGCLECFPHEISVGQLELGECRDFNLVILNTAAFGLSFICMISLVCRREICYFFFIGLGRDLGEVIAPVFYAFDAFQE